MPQSLHLSSILLKLLLFLLACRFHHWPGVKCRPADLWMIKWRSESADSICRLMGNMQTCGFLAHVRATGITRVVHRHQNWWLGPHFFMGASYWWIFPLFASSFGAFYLIIYKRSSSRRCMLCDCLVIWQSSSAVSLICAFLSVSAPVIVNFKKCATQKYHS